MSQNDELDRETTIEANLDQILGGLEQPVVDYVKIHGWAGYNKDDAIAISVALSLKRIADALDTPSLLAEAVLRETIKS